MFIIATTVCTGSESQTAIQFHFSSIPIHYKLILISSTEKNKCNDVKTINKHKSVAFDGESRIIINILYPTSFIRLQKLYQYIKSAKLITQNNITYEAVWYEYDVSNTLSIDFSDTLLPGFYTLIIEFIDNTTHDNVEGYFKNSHINEDEVIQ